MRGAPAYSLHVAAWCPKHVPGLFQCRLLISSRSLPSLPRLQLVMFHGCFHSASGSWPYDPANCPECLGLPEEVAHVKQAGWLLQ